MDHITNLYLTNWIHSEYRENAVSPWQHNAELDVVRSLIGTTCLFGLGEEWDSAFSPIAANRGFPPDASSSTRSEYEKAAENQSQEGDPFGETYLTGTDIAQTEWDEVSPTDQAVVRYQGEEPENWTRPSSINYDGGWKKSNLFVPQLDITPEQEAALDRGETIDYTIPDDQSLLIDPSIDDLTTVELRRFNRWDNCCRWCGVLDHVRELGDQYGESNARVVVWFTPNDSPTVSVT